MSTRDAGLNLFHKMIDNANDVIKVGYIFIKEAHTGLSIEIIFKPKQLGASPSKSEPEQVLRTEPENANFPISEHR